MSTAVPRPGAILAALVSLLALFVLAGCGSSGSHVCPLSTVNCGCGPAVASCPVFLPQYLFAAGLNGQISSFPVTAGSGTLGTPTSVNGPSSTFGITAINNQFLYVSNPASLSAGLINAWSIDSTTGALTTVPGSPFSLGIFTVAGGLAANNNAQVIYVADAGKIDALKAGTTGALSAIAGSPFASGTNNYLATDPQNRFLFASEDDPPGSVAAFTMDATSGALTAVPGSPFAIIPGFVGNTNPGPIVVDSSGNFVYTLLTQTNQLAAFSMVSSSGALDPVPGSPFTTGNGPIAMVAVQNFLYVSNGMDGTLSGYSIDSATGVLTPLSGSPFAIHAGALAVDFNGAHLYTAGAGGMMAFSITGGTGALTQIGSTIPYTGATVLTVVP